MSTARHLRLITFLALRALMLGDFGPFIAASARLCSLSPGNKGDTIMRLTALILAFVALASTADARTDCTTRKSGSVTITSCSGSEGAASTTCRSYMCGSVRKTSCR